MKVRIFLVVMVATLFAAPLAFADGYNLISWPLIPHDTTIQAAFADSMGTGCQLTGGVGAPLSDKVLSYVGGSYVTSWYRTTTKMWIGTVTNIEPDKAYWVIILGSHPAVTLTMTGQVATEDRVIPISPGLSYNFVGTCFPVAVDLDDTGLLASGFTGGVGAPLSDKILRYEGGYQTVWYRTTTSAWIGSFTQLEPGKGYIINVIAGHSFTDDEWVYPVPGSSKGAKLESTEKIIKVPGKTSVTTKRLQTRTPTTGKKIGDITEVKKVR